MIENKLARLQRDGPKPQPARRRTGSSSDISSLSDEEENGEQGDAHQDDEQRQTKEDDAGIHLLHDVDQRSHSLDSESNSVHEDSSSRDQVPSSPENALHLRLGEASGSSPHASASSSRSGLPSNNNSPNASESPHSHSTPPHEEIITTKSRPSFRVRFRSRVRIASGLRHHKSRTSLDSSSSPSSSISAPLRHSSYEGEQQQHGSTTSSYYAQLITDVVASGISGGGGRQLSSSSSSSTSIPYAKGKKFRRYGPAPAAQAVDERTPLFAAAAPADAHQRYGHQRRPSLSRIPDSDDAEDHDDRDARLRRSLQQQAPGPPPPPRKSEEEVMFGKWPWRLLNGHWWLWKLEPICGCCYTEDDTDSDLD